MAQEILEKLSSMIPQIPKMSAREEERESETASLEGDYEAEEEEGLVGEATNSHYSQLVDRLFSGYRGQIQNLEEYVGDLECPELLDHLQKPGQETPVLIASWVESSFDTAEEPASVEGAGVRSLGRAEKMRSLASHYYAIDQGYGNRRFKEKADRSWSGNPALSDFVEEYVKSLTRRKVSIAVSNEVFKIFLRISCFLDAGRRKVKRHGHNFSKDPRVI
jgi:hypothetical protein